jgi:hypothetical protein
VRARTIGRSARGAAVEVGSQRREPVHVVPAAELRAEESGQQQALRAGASRISGIGMLAAIHDEDVEDLREAGGRAWEIERGR